MDKYPKGFYKDKDFSFEIKKLRQAVAIVDSRVKRESPLGEKDINAICLTQIPGDKNSITGGNVRGIYWTTPDHTNKEVQRENIIDEKKYSQFVELFADTYFKEVYDELTSKYKLGRVRILWKLARTTLSWHRDPEPRLHIAILTNPGSIMVIDSIAFNIPADGSVWLTDTTKYHNAFNGGEEDRIHMVATLPDCDMSLFNNIKAS